MKHFYVGLCQIEHMPPASGNNNSSSSSSMCGPHGGCFCSLPSNGAVSCFWDAVVSAEAETSWLPRSCGHGRSSSGVRASLGRQQGKHCGPRPHLSPPLSSQFLIEASHWPTSSSIASSSAGRPTWTTYARFHRAQTKGASCNITTFWAPHGTASNPRQ